MDEDVHRFANMVGATEDPELRFIFRRRNYFLFQGKLLIVKISRSLRPFWGLQKNILDDLNDFDYFLALLTSDQEGWLFSQNEVIQNIEDAQWPLRARGDVYLINQNRLFPIQIRRNRFDSPEHFLRKVEEYDR